MQDDAQQLIEAAGGPAPGSLRAAIANAMVGLKKRYYGRGPEAAKAYIEDDYIFVVLEGGLTRNEETLLAAGKADLVRQYRLPFQETVGPTATAPSRSSPAGASSGTTARSCSTPCAPSRSSSSPRKADALCPQTDGPRAPQG